MNLLITGGAGYIGSHTTLSFLDNNHTVTIIDNLETGNINLIPKKAKFVKGDISDTGLITKILNSEKFDAAVHLAASISVEESVKNPQKYSIVKDKSRKAVFIYYGVAFIVVIIFSTFFAPSSLEFAEDYIRR